jgi:hypothetical protein
LKKRKEGIPEHKERTEALGVSYITGIYDHHHVTKVMEESQNLPFLVAEP